MNDQLDGPPVDLDLGEYCRRVEAHLTRANDGHLVRVVGLGFEVVRQWALDGIPLSVVFRGIDDKADRHRAGRSTRPLRIEFCDGDVRALYAEWRRAIGSAAPNALTEAETHAVEEVRRPSLSKHLERLLAALTRTSGRLELPDGIRTALTEALDGVAALRDEARRLRGAGREELPARLRLLDRALLDAARDALSSDARDDLRHGAERELMPYRVRMPPDVWTRSVELGTDRLVRDHFGLPTLDL